MGSHQTCMDVLLGQRQQVVRDLDLIFKVTESLRMVDLGQRKLVYILYHETMDGFKINSVYLYNWDRKIFHKLQLW